jgi:hypothetical protein
LVLKWKHIEAWKLQYSSFQQSKLSCVPPHLFTWIWNTPSLPNTQLFWNTKLWTKCRNQAMQNYLLLSTISVFLFYCSIYVEHKIIFATQNMYYKRHYFVPLYVIIKDSILHIYILYDHQ